MSEATEKLARVLREHGFASSSEPVAITEETVTGMMDALESITSPDVVCRMVGDSDGDFTADFEGIEGVKDAWIDWLGTFESLELSGEVVERDPFVLAMGDQRGVSKTAGVEVNSEAAALWEVRDDLIVRVEFHLFRATALRAAGINP